MRQHISQIIRELFRQNFKAYPERYPLTRDHINNSIKNKKKEPIVMDATVMNAQEVAKGYWSERNEDEIERDEKAGVTQIDYVEWVMAELADLIPAATNKFQTWASEINKDWSTGHMAEATEDSLSVNFNSEEVARIDYDNGRYTVTGNDKEAVEQLEYMVNR